MRKVIAVILIFATALGLWACGSTKKATVTTAAVGCNTPAPVPTETGLQVGYARESIMPDGQVNMYRCLRACSNRREI